MRQGTSLDCQQGFVLAPNKVGHGSTTLIDRHVGFEEVDDGIRRIYFRQKMTGYFDEKTLKLQAEIGRLKRQNV
ncbi:MAG: hypothetical protein OEM01_11210 [Desulfobulbaceae bacterium]|nr:hypothetical protein [Desulfobulbaceae bacterium]